jgi:hypothetical protein
VIGGPDSVVTPGRPTPGEEQLGDGSRDHILSNRTGGIPELSPPPPLLGGILREDRRRLVAQSVTPLLVEQWNPVGHESTDELVFI